jgi:hypothetical protein
MLGIGCPDRHPFLFMRSPTLPVNAMTATRVLRRERVRSMPHKMASNRPRRPPSTAATVRVDTAPSRYVVGLAR